MRSTIWAWFHGLLLKKKEKLDFHTFGGETLFCHQVGQIWSYRAVFFFPCSKSRDLGPEHGFRACSFKNKGKKSDFHIFGGQKTNKIREKLDEIGQILVPRALNDTKKIRKAGADIFANFGAEKP